MRRKGPGLCRQLRSDVPTDLADPHTLSVDGERRPPHAQMIAQADIVASPLQGNILRPPENTERADRRRGVLGAEHEGAHRPQHAVNIKRLIKPPSPLDERKDCVGAAANDDKIERITHLSPALLAAQQGNVSSLARRLVRLQIPTIISLTPTAHFFGENPDLKFLVTVCALTFAVRDKDAFFTLASDAGMTPAIFQSAPIVRPISLPSFVSILTKEPSTEATVPRTWRVSAAHTGTLPQHDRERTAAVATKFRNSVCSSSSAHRLIEEWR